MKKVLLIALSLSMLLLFSGCCLSHEWAEADCITPKTCKLCQETEGEALGHSWKEATCTDPKTCHGCGIREGNTLPHTPGDWELSQNDYVNTKSLMIRQCTDCGRILEEDTVLLDCLHNGTGFLLSVEDYAERLTVKMQELQEDEVDYTTEVTEVNGGEAQLNIYCSIGRIRETVGELTFGIGGDVLDYDRKDAENSYLGIGGIVSTDHLTVLMPALVQAADPTIDIPEAFSLCESWIWERSIEHNGLLYDIMAGSEAAAAFMIRVDS